MSNHSWGSLFKKYYGEADWRKYLSKSIVAHTANIKTLPDVQLYGGRTVKKSEFESATPRSFEQELGLLMLSERDVGWCKMCGITVEEAMYQITNPEAYPITAEKCDPDVKTEGQKYTMEDVMNFMRRSNLDINDKILAEQCWSLSNSCGVLINPDDKERFVALTFKNNELVNDSSNANIDCRVGDYLVYAMSLFNCRSQKSQAGNISLYEKYCAYIRTYLENTDLYFTSPDRIPLLTGILYDFCKEYNIFYSTYKRNVDNFRFFLTNYMPLISDIFVFQWVKPATDVRLLFDISAAELTLEVPTLSLVDSQVVIGHVLRFVESYTADPAIDALEEKLDAIMKKSNPHLSTAQLWVGFFCYYGEFRTAQRRVVQRPGVYKTPNSVGGFEINMKNVEEFFDKIQREVPNVSLRRQFNGARAHEAFKVFKKGNISFKPISRLNIPREFWYLNVDYFRHANRSGLSEEEVLILNNISVDVRKLCAERACSTLPSAKRFSKGHKSSVPSLRQEKNYRDPLIALRNSLYEFRHGNRGRRV
ncbi:HSP90-like protein [Grapevine rootstock stem lesion associated virus]|uniref:HSP90-like protein n=1 Tax=Grapevine rootstock stem lesion associated virus TaxID=167634 RepID=Q8BEP5_9CLOS|nr:HSP90-like protein [Grapevine rootstock stem lesion associated virus]AAN63470.1 HSP90-like protein [Grapevine rootstock stem lesion associated virus]